MRYEKKAYTRKERKVMVITTFADWMQKERAVVWANSVRLARALKMSPSGTFRKILNEMVHEELLIERVVEKPGRWPSIEYTLYPGTYTPPLPREIRINPGRKNRQQLEMFS
jgi:hypothetical protein